MSKTKFFTIVFAFTHYGNAVILSVRDANDLYINLNVRESEDAFTEDCKYMIDVLHGWCHLDNNWQRIEGSDLPDKSKTLGLVQEGLVMSQRRKQSAA